MIQKPDKVAEFAESEYKFSFLPVLSNLFEKLPFLRLFTIAEKHKLIFNYQFFDISTHIKQIHKFVKINNDMEAGRYCMAVSILHGLLIRPVFDNNDLLYKIKNSFPSDFYAVIKSYLLYIEILRLNVQ
jgi:hypothetical protein